MKKYFMQQHGKGIEMLLLTLEEEKIQQFIKVLMVEKLGKNLQTDYLKLIWVKLDLQFLQ